MASDIVFAQASATLPHQGQLFPLSINQQALYTLHCSAPESKAYRLASVGRLKPEIDLKRLRKALRDVFDQHAALRTTVVLHNGSPMQKTRDDSQLDIIELDASSMSPKLLQSQIMEAASQPFDLTHDALCKTTLIHGGRHGTILLLSAHHLILDGWSFWRCLEEICQAYRTGAKGKISPFPLEGAAYADFITWQQEYLAGPRAEKAWKYWADNLNGELSILNLPTDRPRPAKRTYNGAALAFKISKTKTFRLMQFAKQHGVTLYTLLLTAYQVLLHRYTMQDDIVVGTPVAGRSGSEFRNTLGLFVNTLPMRGDLSGDPLFIDALKAMHRTVRAALVHQYYPFPLLVERLGAGGDPNRTPIFQASLVYQKPGDLSGLYELFVSDKDASYCDFTPLDFGGLDLGPITILQQEDQYELTLEIAEIKGSLNGSWKYHAGLFDRETIGRLEAQFEILLDEIVTDPHRNVSALPLLSVEERKKCIALKHGEFHVDGHEACLYAFFENQAKKTPQAIALCFDEERLTYAALDERANRLAYFLRSRGVETDVRVGIAMDRSIGLFIGLLAVLKAGGCLVPMDPAFPQERLAFMMKDAGIALLLTQERTEASLPQEGAQIICIDADQADWMDESHEPPLPEAHPEDLAYVLYTSGSTGEPKGVAMPHQAITSLIEWQRGQTALGFGARTLQFATIGFDVSFQEIFTCWGTGGTLVVISEAVRRDAERLARFITAEKIERLFLPFVALHQLAEVCERNDQYPSSLREVITSGEQLRSTPAVRKLFKRLESAVLINQYGPTETHVASSYMLPGDPDTWPDLPPIGHGVAGRKIYVLDSRLEPVPIGVPGELCIGGIGLAREYLNRSAETNLRFVADPFRLAINARMYRTGDLARFRNNGEIEFLGRLDDQVKIRGFRVEPGEVENALCRHPAVREAVVKVQEEHPGEGRLIGYIVPEKGQALSLATLGPFLRNYLPPYMIPLHYIEVDALPLTPSGKVNRRALPPMEGVDTCDDGPAGSFETQTEELLAGIYAHVLNLSRIGRDGHFFELGGHSLMSTQVAARVRDIIGVELPLRDLFEAPKVADLARIIDACQNSSARPVRDQRILAVDGAQEPVLSFSQERMWFLHQLDPESAAYNMGVAFRLTGPLDRETAERSLRAIVRRHENLRTTFPNQAGKPTVQIADTSAFTIIDHHLENLRQTERDPTVRRLAADEVRKPFDLAKGPLFRVVVYRFDDQDHALLFCMHHIVSDLWTFGVFFKELTELYEAYSMGREPDLPALQIQYTDYAAWQRQWFSGDVLEEQLNYWKKQLSGVQVLSLPTDKLRPTVNTNRGALTSRALPPELIDPLKRFSTRHGVTPFMTLLAVFKLVLWRYSGLTDIVVGSPIANRRHTETESLTGTFVNTLVMRTDLSGDPTFQELLARIRETALGAFAHQDLPFEKLVEALQPERDLSHAPLIQVLFNLANAPFELPQIQGLAWHPMEIERGAAQFDLSLFVDLEITAKLYAEYNTSLFELDTIKRILRHFQTALASVLTQPGQRLSKIPLLDQEERHRLLNAWNDRAVAYPDKTCFAQLFEAQVSSSSGRVACTFQGKSWSYQTLNKRANRIAHLLKEMGVEPGSFVGLYMNRSLEMVAALLGIMKSGSAYLPLDPGFPEERLNYMVNDAAAAVLITEGRLANNLSFAGKRLVVDRERAHIEAQPSRNPKPTAQPHDAAYVIYTSGSTGRPKGVQISHRSLVNFLCSMRHEPGITRSDRLLALTTLSFDIAGLELFLPLLAGACVVLVDRETAYDAMALMKEIDRSDITVMQATPATWRMLLDSGWIGKQDLKILCGGEALNRDLADALVERGQSLWNLYGPTETTIWSTVWRVDGGSGPVLIGRPIANTEIYILDEHLEPVPLGVPGGLYIGGHGLAMGYLNQPELTQEKFITHPFGSDDSSRIYSAGDLARYLPDGRIECLGRIDHQVKIRGFRIELGEIETHLSKHPAVNKCVVVAREDRPGDKRLVAYIVSEKAGQLDHTEMRFFLKRTLPEYMIPSTIVALDALPMTPNGKIDRKALPVPGRVESAQLFTGPRTHMEKTIARIWAEVLGIGHVDVHDDFFDLGGHSLLATQLAAKLREAFGIDLPLRAIFIDSSVAKIAAKILYSAKQGGYRYHEDPPAWASLVPIQPRGGRKPFFLVSGTYSQEGEFLGYLANLVPHLGLDQPVYGFKARGLDGRVQPHRNAEEMARDYIEEMRAFQPEGPYLLGGECVGGVVAYEMAQQLYAQGQEVGLLVMMDTIRPSWWSARRFQAEHLKMRAFSIFRHLTRIFQSDIRSGYVNLKNIMHTKRRLHFPLNETERRAQRIFHIERTYSGLMFRYRPKIYPGRLTLIVNEEDYALRPTLGWEGLTADRIIAHKVPGSHLTRITDHVKETAERLRLCLDQAMEPDIVLPVERP